jgi:hypothetical protein
MSKKYPGGFISKNPVAPTNAAAKGVWSLTEAANYTKQGIWPATPGAPTIGTATVASTTSIDVAFTPPTNLGAGTVTYTATSSPGGVTGTGSSPITVSGLTTGTAYTFTVTAATPGGTSPASAASNSVIPALPAIGSAYEGGFYAGQISTAGNGVADYNLVVGPLSAAQNASIKWKTSNTSTSGTSSVIDGPTNSSNMNDAAHPAAQFCEAVNVGGYTDWYMPAKNELEICYYNLKPTTLSNFTNDPTGANPNAVPARAGSYTSGTPAQTSAAAFTSIYSQGFTGTYASSTANYWNSTEFSTTNGTTQYFSYGRSYSSPKINNRPVRAVRRVAV